MKEIQDTGTCVIKCIVCGVYQHRQYQDRVYKVPLNSTKTFKYDYRSVSWLLLTTEISSSIRVFSHTFLVLSQNQILKYSHNILEISATCCKRSSEPPPIDELDECNNSFRGKEGKQAYNFHQRLAVTQSSQISSTSRKSYTVTMFLG